MLRAPRLRCAEPHSGRSPSPSRTKVDSDGKVRLILCHDDPGYHNWIDTQRFERGNITHRNLLGEAQTTLTTRVVKRHQLPDVLPPDTVRVTREERLLQMRERFDGVLRRIGA